MLKAKKSLAACCVSALLLSACATGPVKPSYVSPTQYQGLTCEQLRLEYNRIGAYLKSGVEVPKRRSMGVGFGLGGVIGRGGSGGIVPSISVNMGESSVSPRTEYARILGQQEAVAQAATFKGCPLPSVAPKSS